MEHCDYTIVTLNSRFSSFLFPPKKVSSLLFFGRVCCVPVVGVSTVRRRFLLSGRRFFSLFSPLGPSFFVIFVVSSELKCTRRPADTEIDRAVGNQFEIERKLQQFAR